MEELANRDIQVPIVRIGWPDAFIDHGKPDALREKHGISVKATVERTLPYLQKAKAKAGASVVA
jgi:1-deoxy-D-xylulose-5-phosphate synthase